MNREKLAVIFPGIGYHTDKPLLYFAKKLAGKAGYEIKELPYKHFPKNVKGDKTKMEEAFQCALDQTEEMLSDVAFDRYKEILFISKSIGTVVAASYAERHALETRNVYYTPVGEFFSMNVREGIVFHGTKDGWVSTDTVKDGCDRWNLPLFITEGADHSMETGDVRADLENLKLIMEQTSDYLKRK